MWLVVHVFLVAMAAPNSIREPASGATEHAAAPVLHIPWHDNWAEEQDLQSCCVQTTVDSAWSLIIDKQFISSTWANKRLLSLSGLKRHIAQQTQEPVTLETLLHAEPSQTKRQKRSWWSNIESISRCVAGYHNAADALEYDTCRSIQDDICAYAHILRRGLSSNVDVTGFFTLLHRAISNRALNMALRKTIDQTLIDDFIGGPQSRRLTRFGREARADILEQCLDIVKDDYERLKIDIWQFRRQSTW